MLGWEKNENIIENCAILYQVYFIVLWEILLNLMMIWGGNQWTSSA